MNHIQGTALTEFPHKDFIHVADLLYFEGPLLVHYTNARQQHFLYHWVDGDSTGNRWMIYRVERQTILDYLRGVVDLRDVLKTTPSDFIIVLDINNHGEHEHVQLIALDALPEDYLPTEGVIYELPMPEAYDTWTTQALEHLSETERTHHTTLKEKAFYVTVRPSSLRNGTAPEVPQMVSYLRNINDSYSEYGEVNFTKRFASRTNDPKVLKRQLREVKAFNVLRGVEFGTGSFGVALAPNFLPAAGNVDPDVYIWLKELPRKFQLEVVDADFSNPEVVEALKATYSASELDKFLIPFFKIIDSKDYQVSPADKQFKPIDKPIRATEKVREVLIDIPKNLPTEIVPAPEREVVTVVFEKNKDQDIKKMGRKIFSNIISSKTVSEFTIDLKSIHWQTQHFAFKEPLEVKAFFNGRSYEVREEVLNTAGSGETSEEAVKQLSERMAREYIRLNGMIAEFMSAADKSKLETFGELLVNLNPEE